MDKTSTKKRGWFKWVVVGLLVTHVTGMMTAVYVAVGDRTFVALPDYYSKSVNWDQTQEIARKSESLGWTRSVSLSPVDGQGKRIISIQVLDKDQRPVTGLKAQISVYPELFPNLIQKIVLSEGADGTYATSYAKPAQGPLVIELTAARGTDTFVTRANLMFGGDR